MVKKHLPLVLEYLTQVLLEPVLFSFILFILFTTIQNHMSAGSFSAFWDGLDKDMRDNNVLTSIFVLIAGLWLLGKSVTLGSQIARAKHTDDLMDDARATMKELVETNKGLMNALNKRGEEDGKRNIGNTM